MVKSIKQWETVEHLLFAWLFPISLVAGTFWIGNALTTAGEWDVYAAAAFIAGVMLVVGSQSLGERLVKVIQRAF